MFGRGRRKLIFSWKAFCKPLLYWKNKHYHIAFFIMSSHVQVLFMGSRLFKIIGLSSKFLQVIQVGFAFWNNLTICSSLHWLILHFLYANFVQWSILATKVNSYPSPPPTHILSAQTILFCSSEAFLLWLIMWKDRLKMYLPKMLFEMSFCTKREESE